jgi:hypothetical protein
VFYLGDHRGDPRDVAIHEIQDGRSCFGFGEGQTSRSSLFFPAAYFYHAEMTIAEGGGTRLIEAS